ncbi:MAG: nucleotidyltransferase domain-containing protein [Armatimonadota bacterium]|jgi:predicted nucleotidyltransferase
MIDALLPKTRCAILALLFQRPGEAFYQRQIMQAVGAGRGAVQRELDSLTAAGILRREVRTDRTYYVANEACPVFAELRGLMLKTAGLIDVLAAELRGLDGVRLAFVYGSFARGDAGPESDVDLIVVGDVTFAEVSGSLRPAEERLGREVSPTVYSISEFRDRVSAGHHFLTRVLAEEKLFIVGDAGVLAELAAGRMTHAASGQS